jgi:putative flippase GtrA
VGSGLDRLAMTGPEQAPAARSLVRHGAGFVASGVIALAVDTGVLAGLTRLFALSPLIARLIAISCAMVAGWLCHRRWTFAVKARPSLAEFGRYAAVAWSAAAVNYAIYAAILFVVPALAPELAVVLSSVVAMVASYAGMRFGVFANASKPENGGEH